MSVLESPAMRDGAEGFELERLRMQIIEISAYRERRREFEALAQAQGLTLPGIGRSTTVEDRWVFCVRPNRWLIMSPPAIAASQFTVWKSAVAGVGALVDLSSGLEVFHLAGSAHREVLARGCRVDLDPAIFVPGCSAATVMAQVMVTLVALPRGLLMLTPATTAQHVEEWLMETARPFLGFAKMSGGGWS